MILICKCQETLSLTYIFTKEIFESRYQTCLVMDVIFKHILYLVRLTATFNVFIKNNNKSCMSSIHVHFTYLCNKLRGWLGGDVV